MSEDLPLMTEFPTTSIMLFDLLDAYNKIEHHPEIDKWSALFEEFLQIQKEETAIKALANLGNE